MKIIQKAGPGKEKLKKLLADLKNAKVSKVGWFESAKYEDGTPVAYVASIQEFGAPSQSIPSRSFMRTTILEKQQEWRRIVQVETKLLFKNNSSPVQILEIIGLIAVGDIRKKISQILTPPLSMTTILLRKLKKEGGQVTGAAVGDAFNTANFVGPRAKKDKSANIAGVSTKPLVDTGYLLATLINVTEEKGGK